MKAITAALFLALAALPALAQQYGVPIPPGGSVLSADTKKLLAQAFTPDVRLRVEQGPGMIRDDRGVAAGIKLRQNQYYAFADRGTGNQTNYCEEPISTALGERLENVWGQMLQEDGTDTLNVIILDGAPPPFFVLLIGKKPVSGFLNNASKADAIKLIDYLANRLEDLCSGKNLEPMPAPR